MKTFHCNKFKIAIVCAFLFIFQSCKPLPGSWKNEKISSGKRDDFHKLNTEILTRFKANDLKGLAAFFSKEMNAGRNDRQVELISNRLNDNAYELLDEFYVVHKYKDTDTVSITSGEINRYKLLCPYTTPEMYCAFFVPKKSDNKYMVSLVYGKFNWGWKITKLELAPYTINGKTAPELYALARQQHDKKQWQAALYNLTLAVTCFKPCSYWLYPDETDAEKLYTIIHQEVNETYSYPLVLKQLATGPMILRVYSKKADEGGTYPLIYYMTHFDLKDTIEVKKENLQIRNVISKIMPGLGANNKYIFYAAFNKQPTGYTTVDHFDMTDKVH